MHHLHGLANLQTSKIPKVSSIASSNSSRDATQTFSKEENEFKYRLQSLEKFISASKSKEPEFIETDFTGPLLKTNNQPTFENALSNVSFTNHKLSTTASHSRDSAIVITDDPVEDFQKNYNARKSSLPNHSTISLLQNLSHPLDYNNASTSNVQNNIYRIKNSTTNFRKVDNKIMNKNFNFNKTGSNNTHSISLINRNNINSFDNSNINFINRSYGYEDTPASIDFIEIKPKSINEAKQKISKSLSPQKLMHRKLMQAQVISDKHELLSKAPLIFSSKQQYQQILPKNQLQQYQNKIISRKSVPTLAYNNTITTTTNKGTPVFEEVIDLDAYPDSNNINQIKNRYISNFDKNYKSSIIDKRSSNTNVISTAHTNAMYKKPSINAHIQHASTHPYSSVGTSVFNNNFSNYSQNHLDTKNHNSILFNNDNKKHKIVNSTLSNAPLNLSMKPMLKAANINDDEAQPLNLACKQKKPDDFKTCETSYVSSPTKIYINSNDKMNDDEENSKPAESQKNKDKIVLEFLNLETDSTPLLQQEETNSSRSSPSMDRISNVQGALNITEETSTNTTTKSLEENQNKTPLETDNVETTIDDNISTSPPLVNTNTPQRKFTYAPLTAEQQQTPQSDEERFIWDEYLDFCQAIPAPSYFFRHVELSMENSLKKGMLLELPNNPQFNLSDLENTKEPSQDSHNKQTYWVAKVVMVCGSLLMLEPLCCRDEDSSLTFWCDMTHKPLLPLNTCSQRFNMLLSPPEEYEKKVIEGWQEKMAELTKDASTPHISALLQKPGCLPCDQIKEGHVFEVQYDVDPSKVWYARVISNVGGRLQLRHCTDDGDNGKEDENNQVSEDNGEKNTGDNDAKEAGGKNGGIEDFWMFYTDHRLHLAGWAVDHSNEDLQFIVQPPLGLVVNNRESILEQASLSAPPGDVFKDQDQLEEHNFEEGSRLEMLVTNNNHDGISYSFKAAHVSKVINKHYFLVESDVFDASVCDAVEENSGDVNEDEVADTNDDSSINDKVVKGVSKEALGKIYDIDENQNSDGVAEDDGDNETESKSNNGVEEEVLECKLGVEDVKINDLNDCEKDNDLDLKLKIENVKEEKMNVEVNVEDKSNDDKMAGDQEAPHNDSENTKKIDFKGDADNLTKITNEPTEPKNKNKTEQKDEEKIENNKITEKGNQLEPTSKSTDDTKKDQKVAKSDKKVVLCCHFTCMHVFPVGWAEQHGFKLDPVPGYTRRVFNWQEYLHHTNTTAAPDDLFYQPIEEDIEKGMKFEAANPLLPQEICVATVKDVIGPLLSITIDHAPHINLLAAFNSHDIFPIGWCESNHCQLKAPIKTYIDREDERVVTKNKDDDMSKSKESAVKTDNELHKITYNEVTTKPSSKEWCPKIYFNNSCYSGLFLNKSRFNRLPKSISSGTYPSVKLTMHKLLESLLTCAYKSSRVLREFQLETPNQAVTRKSVVALRTKYKNKNYVADVAVCTEACDVEAFLRHICSRLVACRNLICLNPVNNNCPDHCLKIAKSKHYWHFGEKKRKVGRPLGGHSNIEADKERNFYGGRKKKRARKCMLTLRKKHYSNSNNINEKGSYTRVNSNSSSGFHYYDDGDENSSVMSNNSNNMSIDDNVISPATTTSTTTSTITSTSSNSSLSSKNITTLSKNDGCTKFKLVFNGMEIRGNNSLCTTNNDFYSKSNNEVGDKVKKTEKRSFSKLNEKEQSINEKKMKYNEKEPTSEKNSECHRKFPAKFYSNADYNVRSKNRRKSYSFERKTHKKIFVSNVMHDKYRKTTPEMKRLSLPSTHATSLTTATTISAKHDNGRSPIKLLIINHADSQKAKASSIISKSENTTSLLTDNIENEIKKSVVSTSHKIDASISPQTIDTQANLQPQVISTQPPTRQSPHHPSKTQSLTKPPSIIMTKTQKSAIESTISPPASPPQQLASDPSSWSPEQVAQFISQSPCSYLSDIFVKQEIDGKSFLLLTLPTIIEAIEPKLGPALKLGNVVNEVRRVFSSQYSNQITI